MRHADHRVHRRADLVAHVREEGALRLIGRLCLLLGQRQRLVGGFEVGGALAYACFQVGIEAADVAGQPRHLDAAVAQLRDGLCQLLEEGHCRVDALAAVARHALERRHVRGLVKAVPACLGAEDFRVDQIVVEEKLPGEQVADVPVAEHERCHDVPHVVLAAVELERPWRYAAREYRVALVAIHAHLRADAVELGADVLPADGDQHLAVRVEDGAEDAGDLVEVVHHRLDDRRVDDVLQLQQFDVALGREDGVELALHARFALAQRDFRGFALADVAHESDDLSVADAVPAGADFHVPQRTVLAPVHRLELVATDVHDAPDVFGDLLA